MVSVDRWNWAEQLSCGVRRIRTRKEGVVLGGVSDFFLQYYTETCGELWTRLFFMCSVYLP